MFLYHLSFVVHAPFTSGRQIDFRNTTWGEVAEILKNVFDGGGEFIVQKVKPFYNEETYVEFEEIVGYDYFDKYSFICDKIHGYLLRCYIEKTKEYPEGGYFYLVNKKFEFSTKKITFEPYDDEWPERYVNQDFDLALIIFKEVYENGILSSDRICKNFSKTG